MNNQSAKRLTAALGALLVVVLGATIFILLTRPSAPAGPTPTPTGSGLAVATPTFNPSPLTTPSPSASLSPTPTASAAPSVTPTGSPSASPSTSPSPSPSASAFASPSPSASVAPTATPTTAPSIVPTAPDRQFTLRNLGVDSRALGEQRIERGIVFRVDGPSTVSVQVTASSAAGFRLCLYENGEGLVPDDDCSTSRNATLTKPWADSGSSTWNVTIIGTETNVSPFVDLQVNYNANSGEVALNNFRFAGTNNPEYNGFVIDLPTGGAGSLDLSATLDAPSSYDLVIDEVGGGNVRNDQDVPAVSSVNTNNQVSAGATYRLSFGSADATGAEGFVSAEISWP